MLKSYLRLTLVERKKDNYVLNFLNRDLKKKKKKTLVDRGRLWRGIDCKI
jgi:hypothetical protein